MTDARAQGKPTIVVLSFGGSEGASARQRMVTDLQGNYTVLDGARLLAACSELGIPMSRGENLAKASQYVGAVAVIGGSAGGGRLAVAVYSGQTGDVVVKGAFRWPGGAAAALSLVRRGLGRVPQQAEPSFSPDTQTGSGSGGLSFDPNDTGGAPPGGPQTEGDENPLANQPPKPKEQEAEAKIKKERKREGLCALGYLGLGFWMRSFSLNDPVEDRTHPEYGSGASFALQLGLRAWPLAFFLDGIPANIWLRLRYQTVLGLSSGVEGVVEGLSTSMNEVLFDAGYDLKLGDAKTSPHLDLGFGYGALNFSIDWGSALATLPAASYRFVLLGAGLRWPFAGFMGMHVRFDYRFVLGTGEIENAEPDRWYGPSSTGGLAGSAGLHGSYKGFIASAEYTYTRFFYAFDQAKARQLAAQRAAGGALDQFHGIIVALGYSY